MPVYLHYHSFVPELGAQSEVELFETEQVSTFSKKHENYDQCVVWVPSESVTTTEVVVPPISRKKWQHMIPWLLEDQLLGSVESLTIKTGKRQSDNRVAVLAVETSVLEAWVNTVLHACNEGHTSDNTKLSSRKLVLVPDYFALPWSEESLSLVFLGERCVMRDQQWHGGAGTPDMIQSLVAKRLLDYQNTYDKPLILNVFYRAEIPTLNHDLKAQANFIHCPDLFDQTTDEWIPVFGTVKQALSLTREGTVSQLFSRLKESKSPRSKKVALGLLSVLFLVWLGGNLKETSLKVSQSKQIEQSLRHNYEKVFGERYDYPIRDFQSVVSRRISSSEGNLLYVYYRKTIQKIAALKTVCGDCQVENINYSNAKTTVVVSSSSAGQSLMSWVDSQPDMSLEQLGDQWKISIFSGGVESVAKNEYGTKG